MLVKDFDNLEMALSQMNPWMGVEIAPLTKTSCCPMPDFF